MISDREKNLKKVFPQTGSLNSTNWTSFTQDPESWVGGSRSKERDQKSELVLGSTYQIFEWVETTRIEILIFGKQIELPQIEFSRKR